MESKHAGLHSLVFARSTSGQCSCLGTGATRKWFCVLVGCALKLLGCHLFSRASKQWCSTWGQAKRHAYQSFKRKHSINWNNPPETVTTTSLVFICHCDWVGGRSKVSTWNFSKKYQKRLKLTQFDLAALQFDLENYFSSWFHPIWKTLVNLDHFPCK